MVGAMNSERDRHRRGFAEAATREFNFLQAAFGLTPGEPEPTVIRYVGNGVFLSVWHGRQSYEIGLDLGRTRQPVEVGNPYHLADLIAVRGDEAGSNVYRNYTAVTKEAVAKGLATLASDLQKHGCDALGGHAGVFEMMSEQRRARVRAYARALNLVQVRAKAQDAWAAGDYRRVARLLGALSDALSPAEQAKLVYARRYQPWRSSS